MSGDANPPIEPFVEQNELGGNERGPRSYRFGYRLKNTKQVLSMIDIPAEMVDRALTVGFSLTIQMTPSGDVSPVLIGDDDIAITSSSVSTITSLECLVADAVSTENLRLEEAGLVELELLRQRLERAIRLVKEALERQK